MNDGTAARATVLNEPVCERCGVVGRALPFRATFQRTRGLCFACLDEESRAEATLNFCFQTYAGWFALVVGVVMLGLGWRMETPGCIVVIGLINIISARMDRRRAMQIDEACAAFLDPVSGTDANTALSEANSANSPHN